MAEADIDLVYIGGTGRSGSTILQRVLGSLECYLSVGELTYIWTGGFVVNRLCGCGAPFQACEFWNAVMDEAFGGMDQVDHEHVFALRCATHGRQHLPLLAFPAIRPPAFQRKLQEYAGFVEAVYRAIWKVSGGRVIIDASKVPSHAYVLAEIPSIRPKMIHLIRDSRACTYSWQRKKRLVDMPHVEYMKNLRPSRVSIDWAINHTLMTLASSQFAAYGRYRYEDFAREPRRVLTEMVRQLELAAPDELPFLSDDVVRLGSDHAMLGNPSRFEQGAITIRPDVEWQDKLARGPKREVTLLTLPWLMKYGYILAQR